MIIFVFHQFAIAEFIKFLLVGTITVVVNLIVFNVSIINNFPIYVATLFGNLTSILVNFVGLSEIFDSEKKYLTFIKYLISWISYYFLTIFIVSIFILMSLTALESRVVALFLLTPINFLIQRKLIFS